MTSMKSIGDSLGILVILDGFGWNERKDHNAIRLGKTPNLDGLDKRYPRCLLQASEQHVGLPRGYAGNSEVGHLNLGAGRVVYQDFSLIAKAIEDGTFFENPVFLALFAEMRRQKRLGTLHLMGLVSDGGVHSHLSHVFALIDLAKQQGIGNVVVHAFTDGRDTAPTSGVDFLRDLTSFCRDSGVARVGTVAGRFYAMDRDNRWERTEKAYRAIVEAKAERRFSDPVRALRESYEREVTDEFVDPMVAEGYRGIAPGDGIIFFNFRADRARQLTRAITQDDFTGFPRPEKPAIAGYVCMSPYDASFQLPIAFEKPKVPDTLGEVVARLGWRQLRIAETEKYAHVTYFFSGGDERVFPGEERVLIPSPRDVKTYDLKPEMSADGITDRLLEQLGTNHYRLAVVNFANGDMVGHTGLLAPTIAAVETLDRCVGRIVEWVERRPGAFAVITADHGNCEQMVDDAGAPLTAHTTLPVPCWVVAPDRPVKKLRPGALCDVAPTMLELFGVPKPAAMTGKSLLG
jgi:2,3-bisphosphoglycerate-independent phosphoglycerate mutase